MASNFEIKLSCKYKQFAVGVTGILMLIFVAVWDV